MIINIYMFNDHLLFSNNINDAANQLRNIQLQQLEEERYKKLSIQLQEQVNELETFINLIESGQYLSEESWRVRLGRLFSSADNQTDDIVRSAQQASSRKPSINIYDRNLLPTGLKEILGPSGTPSFWNGKWWIVDPKTLETYVRKTNPDGTFTWKLYRGKDGFWGPTDETGKLVDRNLRPTNAAPGQRGNQGNNIPQFLGVGVATGIGAIGSGALSPETDDWDTGPNGPPGGPVGP